MDQSSPAARSIPRDAADQLVKAYLVMARSVDYRPENEGAGPVSRIEEIRDESRAYALRWRREEDEHRFTVGVPNQSDRPALIYTIEAARLICAGDHGRAHRLLGLAAVSLKLEGAE